MKTVLTLLAVASLVTGCSTDAVVKARAWKDAVEPGVSIVNSTQVNVVKAIEADIARGKTQWVSDWFDIPLTE
jgi:hypothetical protein